jgi:hypothetical protein
MIRRVTQGPQEEYRRQLDDLHRRTDWEHGAAARPDPNWEAHGNEPLPAIWGMLDAIMRRPYTRLPRQHD